MSNARAPRALRIAVRIAFSKGSSSGGRWKCRSSAAVIHALQADDDLAMLGYRSADPGEAGHAANALTGSPPDRLRGIAARAAADKCRPGSPAPHACRSPGSCPCSSTTILSARRMVERRCAITMTVRCCHQIGQRPLHQHFGFRVQMRGRFVQDQDRRVLQHARAIASRCRCPPLSLTPALADHGIVAMRQRSMNSSASAFRAASRISSVGASRRP